MNKRSALRLPLFILALLIATTLGGKAQMNINRDNWLQDSDRDRLLRKEKDLLDRYDELNRASAEIDQVMDQLHKKQIEIEEAKKSVRAELSSVRLKLL